MRANEREEERRKTFPKKSIHDGAQVLTATIQKKALHPTVSLSVYLARSIYLSSYVAQVYAVSLMDAAWRTALLQSVSSSRSSGKKRGRRKRREKQELPGCWRKSWTRERKFASAVLALLVSASISF